MTPETPVTPSKATVPQGGKGVTEGGAGSHSEQPERGKTQRDVKGGKSLSLSQASTQDQAQSVGSPVSLPAVPAGMKGPLFLDILSSPISGGKCFSKGLG